MKSSGKVQAHLSHGSVLEDLGFSAAESLELKVKADIYRELLDYIHAKAFSQQQLSKALGLHQPDVSNLLNGRISKFSVSKLIRLAGKLNLGATVRLTRPRVAAKPKKVVSRSTAAARYSSRAS